MKIALLLLAGLACAGAASLPARARPALPPHQLVLGSAPVKQLRPALRPVRLSGQAAPRTILDTILSILHSLGVSDEEIAAALAELQHQMEIVIADMSPEEILEVQHALDDILNQVNSGEADINQVLVDLSIIYTDIYPHLTPEAQAALDQIVQIILDIISGAAGKEARPKTILDTLIAILHALGFTDEDIANALAELQHQMEIVIADMSPEEILEVQHALDDILNQVNSGEADINQVLVDLSIIYTDIYPHLTPEAQAALDQIVQIILDIISGAAGKEARPKTILDTLIAILHALGFTDEDMANALAELQHQMEIVIADMSPEEILEVQHALDDILNQVNSGEADINQVLVDLSIIYTDIYPHLTPEAQAALDQIVQIILDIISGAAGKEARPKTILDTLIAILHALGFTDEDIANALAELQHQMEIVIADMSPEEILEVQHALDDILSQVNSGEADINQVLVDLSIIYTDIYPHLTPEAQAALDQIVQIILDIISGVLGSRSQH
ncbi:uncharacterized protein LOC119575148 [Penaeus monodon]|uniref:uncharacterized protein LOC119575148 n=1 Tax=Penaeus monodon TaxID=6687 RepID=UPI0018A7744E|nr:uncharacterized protein LOC119575148 [Penaeus monodon]